MKRSLAPVLLLCAACATAQPASAPRGSGSPAFRVAVMGDMPYVGVDAPERDAVLAGYAAVLDTIAAEEVAFVVHVGDITGAVCSDSLYRTRVAEFMSMPHPLIYTFGDNEWTDCARDGYDPLERLARLRELFTAGDSSLGRRTLPLERQSADPRFSSYRENARWRRGGVLFVTLHAVGSNNNWGRGAAPGAEFAERNAANLTWMREAFAVAEREGLRGIAFFMQANPFLTPLPGPGGTPPSGFQELLLELRRLTLAFARPVVLVHGDSHTYRVDKILRDDRDLAVLNFTRAETFGSPDLHALLMMVDPADPNLFRFEPLLVRENLRR